MALPTFNQVAADAELRRNSWGDDEYIQFFKDGETVIRVYPEPDRKNVQGRRVTGTAAWLSMETHFKDGCQSWPCPKTAENPRAHCFGCEDKSVNRTKFRVDSTSTQFYFHAIDADDAIHSYKAPYPIYEQFQYYEQRNGTLSDRDYLIRKAKKPDGKYAWVVIPAEDDRKNPDYDPKREFDFDAYSPQDINTQLQAEWSKAAEFYGVDMHGDVTLMPGGSDTPWDDASTGLPPEFAEQLGAQEIKDDPEPPAPKGRREVAKESEQPSHNWASVLPDPEEIDAFDTPTLKEFLAFEKLETPARASRALMVKIAKKHVEAPPY